MHEVSREMYGKVTYDRIGHKSEALDFLMVVFDKNKVSAQCRKVFPARKCLGRNDHAVELAMLLDIGIDQLYRGIEVLFGKFLCGLEIEDSVLFVKCDGHHDELLF